MAKVMLARLCREIKKSEQGGQYSLVGRFAHLPWAAGPVGFVCVVYWERGNETFRQSFALRDVSGNLLDETPATECVLADGRDHVSTAFFYTSFPIAGHYSIDVYQDGVCIKSIPLEVVEALPNSRGLLAFSSRFRRAAPG